MAGLEITFWASLIAIVYFYGGYPLVLWLVTKFFSRSQKIDFAQSVETTRVSMIISAYNEEGVIAGKIENALSLDYPQELLQIIIVSDGSTDRTGEIVAKFASRGVVLQHFDKRIGKTACLNLVIPSASGRVVVFSDANSIYGKGALKALLRPFQDESVGFVTGWTSYGSGEGVPVASSIGLYSRLELMTKDLESKLGSCIGADGAIFAVRKDLYSPLKEYDINDFVIPLSINEKGFRGVLNREAICFEKDAGGTAGEFQRQVRITNRTIRAIFNYRQLLNPLKYGWFSIQLISHKLGKFLVPFFMAALLATNLALIEHGFEYRVTLVAQLLFYVGAILGLHGSGLRLIGRPAAAADRKSVV